MKIWAKITGYYSDAPEPREVELEASIPNGKGIEALPVSSALRTLATLGPLERYEVAITASAPNG